MLYMDCKTKRRMIGASITIGIVFRTYYVDPSHAGLEGAATVENGVNLNGAPPQDIIRV